MTTHPANQYRDHLKPFIVSKMEEFRLLGYDKMTDGDLWDFLVSKKWKKLNDVKIHQLAADILSVKVTDFMNYTTVESFKEASWFDSEDAKNLLKELM